MKKLANLSIAVLVALVLAGPVVIAGDAVSVTMEGTMKCAKCTMHDEGLEECQNVLVVTEDGSESLYYLAQSEANGEYGDVCMKSRTVRVTGMVEEKDGHTWIVASEMITVEDEG